MKVTALNEVADQAEHTVSHCVAPDSNRHSMFLTVASISIKIMTIRC